MATNTNLSELKEVAAVLPNAETVEPKAEISVGGANVKALPLDEEAEFELEGSEVEKEKEDAAEDEEEEEEAEGMVVAVVEEEEEEEATEELPSGMSVRLSKAWSLSGFRASFFMLSGYWSRCISGNAPPSPKSSVVFGLNSFRSP